MSDNRRIRVFVSSTFRDMVEERDELMTQTWPELRRFCRERQVELVEVDLRWGIAEEQSTRKETLKLCLDEIRSCRPFFIGLLGERYGWAPGPDAYTADLEEEQPWLRGLDGRSVTELEILHGVLNNPEMAGRSFFYFRDPAYAQAHGVDFHSEDAEAAAKQAVLKEAIRRASVEQHIPLHENYPDPRSLAALVLEDLKAAIGVQFAIEDIPDHLSRDARDQEAFAETRRRTYIGRPDYFARLDRHAAGDSGPLVLVGDSGSGKSALAANWVEHWHSMHPSDFVFQHYIGGTPDSADHWRLMARLIAEIKRWTDDPEDAPRSHDDLLRDFPLWLAKARIKAEHDGVRCILILDALNQLEDHDHARLLGWLPQHPFTGGLRLVVSTLPGEAMQAVELRGWESLRIEPLTPGERRLLVEDYLSRFGKKLDALRLDRLASAPAAANPLYLKVLLDELRVTGTHDRLDERLNDYLDAPDIPQLLEKVLERYQRDYEHDRPGLVSDSLGLIWAARRGLSETELLHLLRPADLLQLPLAIWSPLRAALEEGLVDRGGILNFAHDFLRNAVERTFASDREKRKQLWLRLADEFERQAVSMRNCDELPWALSRATLLVRLRECLLDLDRFPIFATQSEDQLHRYWLELGEVRTIGESYRKAFDLWSAEKGDISRVYRTAIKLAQYLERFESELDVAQYLAACALASDRRSYGNQDYLVLEDLDILAQILSAKGLFNQAEPLHREALTIAELYYGESSRQVANVLNSMAVFLADTGRPLEAEPLSRRAVRIDKEIYGTNHPRVAVDLNNLGSILKERDNLDEAEECFRGALAIDESFFGSANRAWSRDSANLAQVLEAKGELCDAREMMQRVTEVDGLCLGMFHPDYATDLNNLAQILKGLNEYRDAEPMIRKALEIDIQCLGADHPSVARDLNNLGLMLTDLGQLEEAETCLRRALETTKRSLGEDHPKVATRLSNVASLLYQRKQYSEAEELFRRALAIDEASYGSSHSEVATDLNNLAQVLAECARLNEAVEYMRRSIEIEERIFGASHPRVALSLNNLAGALFKSDRGKQAEEAMRRAAIILARYSRYTHQPHPRMESVIINYYGLLKAQGNTEDEINAKMRSVAYS